MKVKKNELSFDLRFVYLCKVNAFFIYTYIKSFINILSVLKICKLAPFSLGQSTKNNL